MKKRLSAFLCVLGCIFIFSLVSNAQLTIQAIDVAGDSISKGYNASGSPCANGDQEQYNWLTGKTHGANFCAAGSENVFSVIERLECDYQTNVFTALPNHAASGARLLSDFLNQANSIKTYLNAQTGNRLAAVFLGHNDNCGGTQTKTNASCGNADLDPNNYCKTKNDSFEREFRKGLDVLMSISNTRVAVAAPVRVSQLCNFGSKANCQIPASCQFLWNNVSICTSLTKDCSATRITDTYTTMKAYRDILKNVTAEYALIPEGGTSRTLFIGGEQVGGATRAAGANFIYSDAAWVYKFKAEQISCCDCFHPSVTGQDQIGKLMKTGLACTRLNPCCKETGNPLVDGKCERTEVKRTFYNGFF